MTPLKQDLTVWRNVPFREQLSAAIGGVAVDLTGFDARMQIRASQGGAGTPLIEVNSYGSTDGDITFPDAANGVIEVFIEQTALEALGAIGNAGADASEPDSYDYDIVMGGENAVYFYGTFYLVPGVTR